MIRHQTVGKKFEMILLFVSLDGIEIMPIVFLLGKHHFAVVPSLNDVVDKTRTIQAGRSPH